MYDNSRDENGAKDGPTSIHLGLKDNLRLKCGFSMETLCPHEYDIPLVRGGHLEGPHVFGFLIHVFPSEIWTQT